MKLKRYFLEETNFYLSFFEKQHVPSICKNILFNNNNLTKIKKSNENKLSSKITVLNLFPNYLKLELNKNLYSKKLTHKPGLAISGIEKFKSIDEYLKTQCESNFRKTVSRSIKRLEFCFNIQYKMFHGNIDRDECVFLMKTLYTLIKIRFTQRSGRNTIINKWDYYTELAFNNINNKTASLYVIYNGDLPIVLSLNFHFEKLMFSAISSYDLNYSKFSLGNIDIYKQVEWCIHNNIELFDIGYGDYPYKRRWINFTYNFETLYIAKKNSVIFQIYTFLSHSKTKLIHYLILKKVNYWFHDTVDKIKGIDKTYVPKEYSVFDSYGHQHDGNSININEDAYFYLRKPVYDYAYTSQEHISDLKIYKSENDSNSYIIKGKKSESGVKLN